MNEVIEPIVKSYNFRQLLDEMEAIWEAEQRKREKFYKDITPSVKWEFINGEIIVHSPARSRHSKAVQNLFRLLSTYVIKHQLGECYTEKALIVTSRNDYEPNIVFFHAEKAATITADQWKFPIPDFVVEVLSPSTEENDRGQKYKDYASHGVAEYWIIDPVAETLEQYELQEQNQYYLHAKKTVEDHISSLVIKAFSIPVEAIFEEQRNLEVLQEMMGA